MRKIVKLISICLMFFTVLFISNNVYAKTITLEEIVEKFNKSYIVDSYKEAEGSIKATNDNDSITVTATTVEETEVVEFILEGNILSFELNTDEESFLTKAIVASEIIDIIGQLQGYDEGDLSSTTSSEEAKAYTLEKEGYEEERTETRLVMKIDLSKKIPLVDFSNTYIEVEDIESSKEFLSGNGFTERSKGNIYFRKDGYDGECTVLVSEKKQLTKNAYKSILSILEVMFDNEKVINYFKENYSGFSIGDKEFSGFKLEINPKDKTKWEELMIPSDSGYELVRITIDKNLANSSAEEEKVQNPTENIQEIPKAGTEFGEKNILQIIIFVSILSIIIILITNKKERINEKNR